jgi:tyrosine-protein kinase Etk/Wzc
MQTNMSDNATSNAQGSSGDMQDDDEISLLDLLQVVVDNLRLLVLGPLVCGLIAFGINSTIPPTYTAKTQFLPPQQQQSSAASLLASLGALGGLAGVSTVLKSPADQYIAFMKSISVQDALIDRFMMVEKYESKLKNDARLAVTGGVQIVFGKDGLISVEVNDRDPGFAADLANAYVDELRNLLGRLAITEAQQRRMFFEKQLQITKENLTKADLALKSSGINSSVLKSSPASAVEAVARLKASITVQEVKLSNMRSYLTESSPDFRQASSELSSIKSQLAKAEKDEPASLGTSDYVARYREFKYQETMFELYAKQFEFAKVDESREGTLIQVLDKAKVPERNSRPRKVYNTFIAILFSGFGLLLFVLVKSSIKKASQNHQTQLRLTSIRASLKNALGR